MSKPTGERYTIAVDFDGVIHSYTTPWINAHTIPDPPVEGAIEWLGQMVQKFQVIIHTTRGETWRGRRAIRAWLKRYSQALWWPAPGFVGIEEVRVVYKEPKALIYLDDRAVRFEGPGTFPTAEQIHRARPWNKQR